MKDAHRQGVEIKGAQGKGERQLFNRVHKNQQRPEQQRAAQQGQVNPPQHTSPAFAKAGGRFIDAGGQALQAGIKPAFGHGNEAVAIAKDQQQQRRKSQGRQQQQQGDRQHGARHGIAEAGGEHGLPQRARADPALANGQDQRHRCGQASAHHREHKSVAAEHEQFSQGVLAELIQATEQPDQRQANADQGWQGAHQLGSPRPPALQTPAFAGIGGAAHVPAPAFAPLPLLRCHQHRHNRECRESQGNGSRGVVLPLPALQ